MGAEATEELLLAKFQARANSRAKLETAVLKVFKYYDLKGTGTCDEKQFFRTVQDLTAGVPQADLKALFSKYASGGLLDYKAFALALVQGKTPQEVRASQPQDPLARVREVLAKASPIAGPPIVVLAR